MDDGNGWKSNDGKGGKENVPDDFMVPLQIFRCVAPSLSGG